MSDLNDNFKKGLFWDLYCDLERQFQSYLEYVPYLKDTPGGTQPKGNERVYSFKLLNLILSIGGYIDSVFKEMARYGNFKDVDCRKKCNEIKKLLREKKTVPVYMPLQTFESEYYFSKRNVVFKCLPQRESITPFAPSSSGNNVPKWWTYYNGLKHDLSVNLKNANLRNIRDALAGAFILNVVHVPALFRLNNYGLLKPKFGSSQFTETVLKSLTENSKPFATIETNLFIYDFDTEPSYK